MAGINKHDLAYGLSEGTITQKEVLETLRTHDNDLSREEVLELYGYMGLSVSRTTIRNALLQNSISLREVLDAVEDYVGARVLSLMTEQRDALLEKKVDREIAEIAVDIARAILKRIEEGK